jgi:hypothetical protein
MALVAVAVALALIAAFAAIVVPIMAGHQQMLDVTRTRQILQSLEFSIGNGSGSANGGVGFKSTLSGKVPARLSQLVIQITGSNSDQSCTGSGYGGGDQTTWATKAPYSGLYIPFRVGVSTPIGTIRDTVLPASHPRVPSNELGFMIDSVTPEDAQLLDLLVDGTSPADSAHGLLVYDKSPSWASRRVVYYLAAISGC